MRPTGACTPIDHAERIVKRESIRALGLVAIVAGCSTLPQQIEKAEGRVLVKGNNTSAVRVLIRTVDGGDVLWIDGDDLGSEAWLDPGHHSIGVMCRFQSSWGTRVVPGQVEIDVVAGSTTRLDGTIDADGKRCLVVSR
jgi:hypothetical protein